jgi:hypothetical protein
MLTRIKRPEMVAIFVISASPERISTAFLIMRGGKILIISTATSDIVPKIK